MHSSTQLTFEELRRGEQRQKFLSRIVNAGKTSGLQFVKALEEAISVVQQVLLIVRSLCCLFSYCVAFIACRMNRRKCVIVLQVESLHENEHCVRCTFFSPVRMG